MLKLSKGHGRRTNDFTGIERINQPQTKTLICSFFALITEYRINAHNRLIRRAFNQEILNNDL